VDQEMAQSLLTFLGGTIYALGGEMQRIGKGVFLFTPPNVDVSLPGREDMASESDVAPLAGLDFWQQGSRS
jgi:FtsZ-interacting cell division protein YlmF